MNINPHIVAVHKELIAPLAKAMYGIRSAVCSLLTLKSLDKSGVHSMRHSKKNGWTPVLKLNIEQRNKLMELCMLSAKQIDNHVNIWLGLGLAKIDKDGYLRVASYDEICKYFGVVKTNSRLQIKCSGRPLKITIEQLALKYEEERCAVTWRKKVIRAKQLNGNSELMVEGRKACNNPDLVFNRQKALMAAGLSDEQMSDNDYLLLQFRACFSLSTETVRLRFGYASPRSVSVMKRRLVKWHLCWFEKQHTEIDGFVYDNEYMQEKSAAARYGRVSRKVSKKGVKRLYLTDKTVFHDHNAPIPQEVLQMQAELKKLTKKQAA